MKSFSATMAVRPLFTVSSKFLVGRLNNAAVRALPIEMFDPAGKVLSSRSRASVLPPSSTTAITPVGLVELRFASAAAAAMTFFAPSSVRPFLSAVGPASAGVAYK